MDTARLMAAYVRGHAMRTGVPALERALTETPVEALTDAECECLRSAGQTAGLKLYRFKPHDDLPRVQKVMGFLRGVWPESLLDVGSGRGVFLFPLMAAFPHLPVTSMDLLDYRVQFLQDVAAGGMAQLTAIQGSICDCALPDKAFDVVTLLEVLEHIPDVEAAIRSALRLARRYVVVTVPSKPDNNPEHIHLLTKERLTELFSRAGCTQLRFDGVPGHLFMIASL